MKNNVNVNKRMYWNRLYAKVLPCFVICIMSCKETSGYPFSSLQDSLREDTNTSAVTNSSLLETLKLQENHTESEIVGCFDEVKQDEYILLTNGEVFVNAKNKTYKPTMFYLIGDKLCLRSDSEENKTKDNFVSCKKWIYEPEEFIIMENGSVKLYDEILDKNTYEIDGEYLKTCAPDYIDPDPHSGSSNLTQMILIYIGKVGTCISIIALIIHLTVFCLVPSLRNLPGYNLSSMSFAFLIAYCFTLIGQISQVLGTACVVSGALIHYFLLAAFFWMNVMTFDVWRALRLATTKLVSTSTKINTRKFLFYSFYAWGIPIVFSVAAAIVDKSSNVPDRIKPGFGRGDMCWITQDYAKLIFFVGPAFVLFTINAIFFIVCAFIIKTNTMKDSSDNQSTARRNFTLYVRLGLIMGMTWLIGIISVLLRRPELWFVFDVFNSLQGLFIFIFFPCSKKAWDKLKKKFRGEDSKTSFIENSATVRSDD